MRCGGGGSSSWRKHLTSESTLAAVATSLSGAAAAAAPTLCRTKLKGEAGFCGPEDSGRGIAVVVVEVSFPKDGKQARKSMPNKKLEPS